MTTHILICIAESVMEMHVQWCGSPLHPSHNRACLIAYERFSK
jgi:hypothetical protein